MLRGFLALCPLLLAACTVGTDEPFIPIESSVSVDSEGGTPLARRHEAMPSSPPVENLPSPPLPGSARYAGQGAAAGGAGAVMPGKMLIRNGNARLEVRSIDPAIILLRDLSHRFGGEIGNLSLESRERYREAKVELRIPSESFDIALASLDSIGKVEAVTVTTADVGEEYIDLNVRMANGRKLEQRLIDLLATRTGKLEEVLTVERELARVRAEIEQHEGRIRYLEARIAMSTISVSLHEPWPIMDSGRGGGVIRSSFRGAWSNFVGMVAGMIELSGVLLPLGMVLSVSITGVRRWRRRGRQ